MIIPLDRKPDWHNPPLVTLAFILINCLVYFGFQTGDDERLNVALEYYFSSDLPQIELPAYQQHLNHTVRELTDFESRELFWEMQTDGDFMVQLKSGQIIAGSHARYAEWKVQSAEFRKLLDKVVGYRYSLKTADPELLTIFSHMFLHADIFHLIGNMLFLFLFGFVVEITLNRAVYFGAYLLAGLSSALFDIVLAPGSGLWGLGASGAISGLCGMYTVLFGFRKVRIFYTLLFYFDYIRVPAIVMLPVWLGFEIYQQIRYPDSGVNNLAHIGGMLAGALIASGLKKFTSVVDIKYLDETKDQEQLTALLQRGMEEVARLDYKTARKTFNSIIENYPDNISARTQLFNLYKNEPHQQVFHDQANYLLSLDNINQLSSNLLLNVYSEYWAKAKPGPRLQLHQLFALALRFIRDERLEEAENIVLFLLRKKPDFEPNASGLAALITYYYRNKRKSKYEYYFSLLNQSYPAHLETRQIRQIMGR